MTHAQKLEYAKVAAEELKNNTSLAEVIENLKKYNLYESNIDDVIASARNIIGDELMPIIRSKILAGESLRNVEELGMLDEFTLNSIAKKITATIKREEKAKVSNMLKKGHPPNEILKAVNQKFYSKAQVAHQVATYDPENEQNGGDKRSQRTLVGGVMITLGVILSLGSMQGGGGRLFYGLIGVGLILLIKGLFTVKNPY